MSREVLAGATLQLDGKHSTGAEPAGMLPAPPPSGRTQGEKSLKRTRHKLSGKTVKLFGFGVGFEPLVERYRDLTETFVTTQVGWSWTPIPGSTLELADGHTEGLSQ